MHFHFVLVSILVALFSLLECTKQQRKPIYSAIAASRHGQEQVIPRVNYRAPGSFLTKLTKFGRSKSSKKSARPLTKDTKQVQAHQSLLPHFISWPLQNQHQHLQTFAKPQMARGPKGPPPPVPHRVSSLADQSTRLSVKQQQYAHRELANIRQNQQKFAHLSDLSAHADAKANLERALRLYMSHGQHMPKFAPRTDQ